MHFELHRLFRVYCHESKYQDQIGQQFGESHWLTSSALQLGKRIVEMWLDKSQQLVYTNLQNHPRILLEQKAYIDFLQQFALIGFHHALSFQKTL